jgi:NAD(P)-dependent dehydrogenase (short-subunit alcohol dehydrogenase family)
VQRCLAGDEETVVARLQGVMGPGYGIAKLALARWVRRMSVTDDWIGAGIRLNAVAPGLILSPMTEGGIEEILQLKSYPRPTDEPGRPDEVAELIRYLLSPSARYFVGSFVVMDGGTEAVLRADDWPASP